VVCAYGSVALVLVAASTGLRQSELFGLKWGDIDFAQNTMSVTRSIVCGVVRPCKTESSQKPVPVHPTVFGVPLEIALYVLPNAKSIRLYESGSLLHVLHKWTVRTCFNAQEEIFQASMDEIAQLGECTRTCSLHRPALPFAHRHHHAHLHEGSHFCGVNVWLDFPNVPADLKRTRRSPVLCSGGRARPSSPSRSFGQRVREL